MKNSSGLQITRKIVQGFFALMVFLIVLIKYLYEQGAAFPFNVSGLHGLCPFAAAATFGRFVSLGKFIPETQASNFWIFSSVILLTILFGKIFCGWFCPLGSVQEYIFDKGRKIRVFISGKETETRKMIGKYKKSILYLDRILASAKYFILLMILIQTTRKITLVFAKIDPFYALFNFWTGDIHPPALIVLGIVLLLSVFIYRPWCRWFCPLGAILGIVQLISPVKIRRNKDLCINCRLCSKECPESIDVSQKTAVLNTECIKCGKCVSVCPVPGALDDCIHIHKKISHPEIDIKNTKTEPESKIFLLMKSYKAVIFIIVFFIPILYGKFYSDYYYKDDYAETGSINISSDYPSPNKQVTIKSSMILEDLANEIGITTKELKNYLGIEINIDNSIKLRDIEDLIPEITLKYIKRKISEYTPE